MHPDTTEIYYRHPAQATNHCAVLPPKEERENMTISHPCGIAIKMNGLKRGWFPVVSWEAIVFNLEEALRLSPQMLADVKAIIAKIEGGA